MYPHPNALKEKLADEAVVTGLYIQTPSVDCVEIAAAAGFDYVIIDEEHGSFGFSDTVHLIRAAEASRVCPIVRVAENNPARIRKVIEAGALGVFVPNIESATEAREAISAAKYLYQGNGGSKGACPTNRAARSLGRDWERYVKWSNDNVMVTLAVESQAGLAQLDEILAVPGIDSVALGRFDLAHEMGLYGKRYGGEMEEIFEGFVAKADAAQVRWMARLSSLDPEVARIQRTALVARGARLFTLGSDRQLLDRVFRQVLRPMGVETMEGAA